MDKVELIKEAIKNGGEYKSKLSGGVLDIGGYTGLKIRHTLNNLGSLASNVCEIGSHRGSTFCATVFGNSNIKSAYFCDNFTEFDDGTVRQELLSNTKQFVSRETKLSFLEKDCFTITKNDMPDKIDLYIYDGNHSFDAQKKAISYFKNFLAKEFILVVDDFNWEDVKNGTQEGIFSSNMKILYQAQLGSNKESDGDGYWNGLFVALIQNA